MGSLRMRVGCEIDYDLGVDTAAVFQVQPYPDGVATVLDEKWETRPGLTGRAYSDIYGNTCHRMTLPAGACAIRYDATVEVSDATEEVDLDARETRAADLPDDTLIYTLPSRYVLPDVLGDQVWELFGSKPGGYRRVAEICDYVNGHLRFEYGTSTPLTTAADAHGARVGVCRDFTHLGITFCRALSIPARYVFGYLPDIGVAPEDIVLPMDFAAWMEVFLDGRWWTFDPRNNRPRVGRVVIGRGRDAGDVAMVTTFGSPKLTRMDVVAEEIGADG